ncbi:MAG: FAD-binding oxidoreductase [Hyphomicrobium sp.]|uniref:NAD(P)/FAD-dependent oxidoreductase n=1 Tax=Hyphomicrobium sp. TaxID=82 RepID=UPI0039E6E5CA
MMEAKKRMQLANEQATYLPTARELADGSARASARLSFSPYWWEAVSREAEDGDSFLPRRCDVVVVGSGFTGLSGALTLLRNGRQVVVIERGRAGFGASTRNGGQIGSGNQKFRVKKLIAIRGRKKAEEMLREGTRMLDHIAALISQEKIECHFRRCGRFRAAVRSEHYEAMAQDMRDLKDIAGVESSMVPRSEQSAEIDTDCFFGGSLLPNDASLHPALYHAGLLDRIKAAGGKVLAYTPARHITRAGPDFQVATNRGVIVAKDVVIATNGYTDGLVPELGRRIVPIGSALIATDELPATLFDRLLPRNRVYGNTNRVFFYFRGAPDARRIIWGGRVGRLVPAQSLAAVRHLAGDMLHVFPDLKDIAITHAWDGQIGYTYDEVPHIGCTRDGIHYALGYCGTGVSRATYFGTKIALKVLDKPEGRTSFDDLTFPAYPAHPVAKHAVPFVETWYRIRDAANF